MGLKWFKRKVPVESLEPAQLALSIEDKYQMMTEAVKDYQRYYFELKLTKNVPTQKIKDRESVHQFKCASHLVDPVEGFTKMNLTKE